MQNPVRLLVAMLVAGGTFLLAVLSDELRRALGPNSYILVAIAVSGTLTALAPLANAYPTVPNFVKAAIIFVLNFVPSVLGLLTVELRNVLNQLYIVVMIGVAILLAALAASSVPPLRPGRIVHRAVISRARPLGITLVAVFSLFLGIPGLCFAIGYLPFGVYTATASFSIRGLSGPGIFLLMAGYFGLSLLLVTSAVGLLKARWWGWRLARVTFFANCALAVLHPVAVGPNGVLLLSSLFSVAVSIMIIFYLNHETVKSTFI